jgi:amino acid transporter
MTTPTGTDPAPPVRRIAVIWLVLSVIGVLLMIFALGPHIPPPSDTAQSKQQHEANIVISAVLTPIAIGLFVYFGFALSTFRQRGELIEDTAVPSLVSMPSPVPRGCAQSGCRSPLAPS